MMNNMKKLLPYKAIIAVLTMVALYACEDLVEEGYRADYPPSDAQFSVAPIALESGATGDVVSYNLTVSSDHEIQSCVVQAANEGAGGSGYDVTSDGYDDPFADHNYGTIKPGIKSFAVKYDYIIPADINKSKITFTVIDEMGKVSRTVSVSVVPTIKRYSNKKLYARNNIFFDAFASVDGLVYPNINSNYSTESQESITVQEKIDIIFYHDPSANRSFIASPANGAVNVGLQIANATLFKKLDLTPANFSNINAGSLVSLTKNDSISYYGSSSVSGFSVGDVIGFTTDLNALHSLKTGLILVTGLHPANVNHYPGTSYVMECDIVTQID